MTSDNSGAESGFRRGYLIAVVFLTIVGAALRFHHLNSGLWYDEIKTVLISIRLPLIQLVTHFPDNNDHLFYSLMAKLSTMLFGESPWSVRLPAALFGIASIPMLYRVGTSVTSRREAFLATAILTVSYHHVWFSQNARGYTALLFWVLLATFLLLQWVLYDKKKPLVGYAVVAALGSYTHLTMVFVVVAHAMTCIYVLWVQKKSENASQDWRYPAAAFAMGGMLTILLYAPLLADVHRFFAASPSKGEIATPIWAFWSAISGLQVGFGTLWSVSLAGVIAGVGFLSYFRQRVAIALIFVLPAPVTLTLAIAMGRPIFPRFIFFLIGFALLIAVRGATTIGDWISARTEAHFPMPWLGSAMAIVLTIGAVGVSIRSLPYEYRYPKQDFRGAIDFVEKNRRAEDLVAVFGKAMAIPVLDYFRKPWLRVDTAEQLRSVRLRGRKVWLVYTTVAYMKANTPALWDLIQRECARLESFEGTVAGGKVYVDRCPPADRETE